MFSDPDVIKSSRNFVCIRIESYESKENQDIVRSYLGGRFENTAFCILSPDGKERLTRAGRGPNHVSRDFDDIAKIASLFVWGIPGYTNCSPAFPLIVVIILWLLTIEASTTD